MVFSLWREQRSRKGPFSTGVLPANPAAYLQLNSSNIVTFEIQIMDAAFMPTEIAVKHFVHHKFTLDLGPSITSLGKPIRNFVFGALVIYCVSDILRSVAQAVLNKGQGRDNTNDTDDN